jgi:TPR repeat protein
MKAFFPLVVIFGVIGPATPAMAGSLEDGTAAYERYDFAAALEALGPLADNGNPKAQLILGKMYLGGQGVPLNGNLAAKWFRLAASRGDADAQDNLGLLYLFGRGVRQDYAEAAKWFRLAAEQGKADAQQCLGGLYALGQGVPQDPVQAHVWYSLAAIESRNAAAADNRDLLASKMTPDQLALAARLVGEWRAVHRTH